MTKAGKLLAINHPRITALHGAEHVLALFFKDVYTKVSLLLCVMAGYVSFMLRWLLSSRALVWCSVLSSEIYLTLQKG